MKQSNLLSILNMHQSLLDFAKNEAKQFVIARHEVYVIARYEAIYLVY